MLFEIGSLRLAGRWRIDTLERAVHDARELGYGTPSVSGGEPVLYSDLGRLLAFSRSLGMRTTLVSNGTLLHRRLESIAPHLDGLALSLDGPPTLHNELRASTRAFAALERGIDAVRSVGMPFALVYTVTARNWTSIPWAGDFAVAHGARLLQLHPLEPIGRASLGLADHALSRDHLARLYLLSRALEASHGARLAVQLDLLLRRDVIADPGAVYAAGDTDPERLRSLVIEADGMVVPIAHGVSRYYAVGSLSTAPLAASWAAPASETTPRFTRCALTCTTTSCGRRRVSSIGSTCSLSVAMPVRVAERTSRETHDEFTVHERCARRGPSFLSGGRPGQNAPMTLSIWRSSKRGRTQGRVAIRMRYCAKPRSTRRYSSSDLRRAGRPGGILPTQRPTFSISPTRRVPQRSASRASGKPQLVVVSGFLEGVASMGKNVMDLTWIQDSVRDSRAAYSTATQYEIITGTAGGISAGVNDVLAEVCMTDALCAETLARLDPHSQRTSTALLRASSRSIPSVFNVTIQNSVQANGEVLVAVSDLKTSIQQDLAAVQATMQSGFDEINVALDDINATLGKLEAGQDTILAWIADTTKQQHDAAVAAAAKQVVDLAWQTAASSLGAASAIASVFDPKLGADIAKYGGAGLQALRAGSQLLDAVTMLSKGLTVTTALGSAAATGNFLGAAFQLIGMFSDTGPTPDQMILDQIDGIRKDIRELHERMEYRFDRIESQLNQIYDTLVQGLDEINVQLGRLNTAVASIEAKLTDLTITLSGLEAQLSVYFQTVARQPLWKAIDDVQAPAKVVAFQSAPASSRHSSLPSISMYSGRRETCGPRLSSESPAGGSATRI